MNQLGRECPFSRDKPGSLVLGLVLEKVSVVLAVLGILCCVIHKCGSGLSLFGE